MYLTKITLSVSNELYSSLFNDLPIHIEMDPSGFGVTLMIWRFHHSPAQRRHAFFGKTFRLEDEFFCYRGAKMKVESIEVRRIDINRVPQLLSNYAMNTLAHSGTVVCEIVTH